MIWGLDLGESISAKMPARAVSRMCFQRGLRVETAGANSEVVKLLPPLNAKSEDIRQGLTILVEALAVLGDQTPCDSLACER